MRQYIIERKQARSKNRRVYDVFHSGVSEVSILEILATPEGLTIFDADGNTVFSVNSAAKDDSRHGASSS